MPTNFALELPVNVVTNDQAAAQQQRHFYFRRQVTIQIGMCEVINLLSD